MTTRDVRPPDLEMRVKTHGENGKTRLSYILHSPTGVVAFAHREIAGPTLQGSPAEFQSRLLHKLEQLGQRVDVDGSCLLPGELDRKLASLGRDLWRELIPPEIRYAYRDIRRAVRSWMIISDEPWIPWELIKPYDESHPEDVLDDDFLALRFELTRWLAGDKTPAQQITIRQFAAFRTAMDLPHAEQERSVLTQIAQARPIVDATPEVNSAAESLSFLEASEVELLHFIGHGIHDAGQAEESGIPFPDGSLLRPVDLGGPLATRISRTRPLVFLNACWAGQQGWSLTRLGGWVPRWVTVCGCGAFVAPMWPARDKTALAFAVAFYSALTQGATLGQAALAARRHVVRIRPGDPSTLAYAIYGHPNARLSFGEEISATADPVAAATATEFRPLVPSFDVSSPGPQARRKWIAMALCGMLLALLLAMRGRWAEVAGWMEPRQETPAAGTQEPARLSDSQGRSPAEPKPAAQPDRQRDAPGRRAAPPPKTNRATMIPSPETTTGSSEGTRFEIVAASGVPRSILSNALQKSALPLADLRITGWTLHVDVDAPRITPHVQDGYLWQACQLEAHCRARRQGTSLDLGTVPAVNSQVNGARACEAAAETLAKTVIYQFVQSLRKGTT